MADLSKYVLEGSIKKKIEKLAKIDLIIIGELGYLKMDKEKRASFFNLSATAILDRLIHHSHIVSISGESYRVKCKTKEEKT